MARRKKAILVKVSDEEHEDIRKYYEKKGSKVAARAREMLLAEARADAK